MPVVSLCAVSFLLASCGNTYYFAGRPLPPSGLKNRVMVALENPAASGSLAILDAFYDVRNPQSNENGSFSISGYAGSFPSTIQNMPEQEKGGVYSSGDGKFTLVDYSAEKGGSAIAGLPTQSTSVFISRNLLYAIAANQTSHIVAVVDQLVGRGFYLNVPGINRVSINASGSVALAFTQDTDDVYSMVHLTVSQQSAAAASSDPQHFNLAGQPAQDCEPQTLPVYCAFKVTAAPGASFSRPIKAMFSADGASAFILNCGPECGGTQAGITTIPITAASLNNGSAGPSGVSLVATSTTAVPGGVTNALQNGHTMYVTGQRVQTDGYLAGYLTILDTSSLPLKVTSGPIAISDGAHVKMAFADDSTLWIGSVLCHQGERSHHGDLSGCLTIFNTATNTVTLIPPYKGDATGIAPIPDLHKVYTVEGGQVYIYNTPDGSQRDNSKVTSSDVASDITYMDAASDGANTTY